MFNLFCPILNVQWVKTTILWPVATVSFNMLYKYIYDKYNVTPRICKYE